MLYTQKLELDDLIMYPILGILLKSTFVLLSFGIRSGKAHLPLLEPVTEMHYISAPIPTFFLFCSVT